MRTLAILALLVLLVTSCPRSNTPPSSESPSQSPSLDRGVVTLTTGGKTVRVRVEIARTPEQRARGLMYRKQLGAYEGMYFIFDREERQSFWMQNTYIPLDMIFINRQNEVVGLIENAAPMTTEGRSVDTPSIYVLEVRGGFVKAQGLSTETRVELEVE